MTGLDLAYTKGFGGSSYAAATPEVNPYESKWWQSALYYLGVPQEVMTKTIANVFSSDPKYDFDKPSSYFNQQNFATLLHDTGMDSDRTPVLSTTLGLVLGGFLDPLNYVTGGLGGTLTKAGTVGKKLSTVRRLESAGTQLSKGQSFMRKVDHAGKTVWEISTDPQKETLNRLAVQSLDDSLPTATRDAAHSQFNKVHKAMQDTEEINTLLKDYQAQGLSLDDIELAPTRWEQARRGQRVLFGMQNPLKAHIGRFMGGKMSELDQAAITGSPAWVSSPVLRATGALGEGLKSGATKLFGIVADKLSGGTMPIVRTQQMQALGRELVRATSSVEATTNDLTTEIVRARNTLGKDLTEQDVQSVLTRLEAPIKKVHGEEAGKAVLDTIGKVFAQDLDIDYRIGKSVEMTPDAADLAPSGKLTAKRDLAYYGPEVSPADLPRAAAQWNTANVPKVTVGQHPTMLTDDYIVVKPQTPNAMEFKPSYVKGIDGVAQFQEITSPDGGKLLVGKRSLGLHRVESMEEGVSGVRWSEEHTRNLEVAAAALSAKGISITSLSPRDVLVSPNGALRIINYDSLSPAKNVKSAREVSKTSLEHFLDRIGRPQGPSREFQLLSSDQTAKKVFKSQRDYSSSRFADSTDPKTGVMSAHDLLSEAENMHPHREYVRTAFITGDVDPLYQAKASGNPIDFERANNIATQRQAIREQLAAGQDVMMKPIEIGRHPEGWIYVREGRDRLTAAILEGVDTIPVKKVDYTGEQIEMGAYFMRDPKTLQELASNHSDFAVQGLRVQFNTKGTGPGAVVNIHPQQALGLAGGNVAGPNKQLVADFVERLRSGQPVEPVSIVYDLAKQKVTKSDGLWRAKAAEAAGVTDMPMYVTFTRNGKFTKKLDAGEIESALKLTKMTDNGISDQIDKGYKLTSLDGDRVMLDRQSIQSGTGGLMLSKMAEILGFSETGFSPARANNLVRQVIQTVGSQEAAIVKIADALSRMQGDLSDFVAWTRSEFNIPTTGILRSSSRQQIRQMLDDVKKTARGTMDELSSKGVFTPTSVQDANALRKFALKGSKNRQGGIVEVYSNGVPTFASGTLSHEELVNHATKMVHQYGDIESVMPFQQIRIVSATGDQLIEGRQMMFGRSKLADVVPYPNVMKISDDLKAELKKDGIFFNPTAHELSGVLNKDTGVLVTLEDGTKVRRNQLSFFFTKSGQMFVGTRGHGIHEILQKVYDEGPVFASEFGIATREGIFIDNAFNASLTRAGTAEIKVMEGRIKQLARKFEKLGFSQGTPLEINAGFDPSVWQKLYGKHVTIGDVLKESWGLSVPKELRNMPLDVTIDAAHSIVNIERPRFKNPNIQGLFDLYQDAADKLFIEEMKAGIPVNYIAPYFARFTTREGKEALGKMQAKFEEWLNESKNLTHKEGFIKQRLLSDYTTVDVNNLVKEFRRQKAAGASPEALYSTLVDKLAKEKDYKFFSDLADEMNKIDPTMSVDFFHQDPLLSLAYRTRDSISARTSRLQVDLMAQHGAAWVGTAEDYALLRKGSQGVKEAEDKLNGVVEQLRSAEEELVRVTSAPEIDRLTKDSEKLVAEIEKLKLKRGEKEIQVSNLKRDLRTSHGIIANDVNIRGTSAYVDGATFQRLVENGMIQDAELTSQVGQSLVEVPLSKYSDMLDKEKVKIMLFTEEARPLALRHFGSMDRATGFTKVIRDNWDHYQDLWRQWSLLPIPAYHVRNAFSNVYMMWLGGFKNMDAMNTAHHMFAVLSRYKKGQFGLDEVIEVMDKTMIPNEAGGVSSLRDIYQEFIKQGGLQGHLHFNEFSKFTGGTVKNSEFISKGVQQGLIPSSEVTTNILLDNKLLQTGRSIGNHIENVSRFATFVDAWQRMGDFTSAGLHMKSVLYDYNNLSLFERNVLRRVFPFYSWSRQNIPRMLETLMTDPLKHYRYARWVQSWEQTQLEGRKIDGDSEMPEWLKHSMLIGKDKEGNWILKTVDGFIPTYEVFQMFENPASFVGQRVTPFLKYPVEQLANYSWQTGRKLEEYEGEPAQGGILRSLGFTRKASSQGPLGMINVIANEQLFNTALRPAKIITRAIESLSDQSSTESLPLGIMAGVIDLFIGRAIVRDPAEMKAQVYGNWQRTQTTLLSAARKAEAQGNEEAASQLRKLLLDLEVRKPIR